MCEDECILEVELDVEKDCLGLMVVESVLGPVGGLCMVGLRPAMRGLVSKGFSVFLLLNRRKGRKVSVCNVLLLSI